MTSRALQGEIGQSESISAVSKTIAGNRVRPVFGKLYNHPAGFAIRKAASGLT